MDQKRKIRKSKWTVAARAFYNRRSNVYRVAYIGVRSITGLYVTPECIGIVGIRKAIGFPRLYTRRYVLRQVNVVIRLAPPLNTDRNMHFNFSP